MRKKKVPFHLWSTRKQAGAFLIVMGVTYILFVALLVYMKSAPEIRP